MVYRPASPLTKHAWWIAIAAILIAVLPPDPPWSGPGPLFLFGLFPASRDALLDSLQNICLYVPFGLALSARGISRRRLIAAAGALSGATELLQVIIPGRDPSMSDVLANVTGAWGGAILFSSTSTATPRRWFLAVDRYISSVVDPEQRYAGVLSFAWAALVAATLIGSVRLLVPAPVPPPYLVGSGEIDRSVGPIRIGSNGYPDGNFSGLIDEVRIFNGARSTASIAGDMVTPVVNGGPPTEGLIAAYSFDSPKAALRDDSGHGHDATQAGTRWTSGGRFGGAVSFDGSGEVLVPAGAAAQLHDRWTIEAWIHPIGEPAPEATVIATASRSIFLFASSEHGPFEPIAGGIFGGGLEEVRPLTRIKPGAWTHVALTYDGEALRFFLNGALASTHIRWSSHRLVNASIDGIPLPAGRLDDAFTVGKALRDQLVFRGTIACGARAQAVAPVFLIRGLWDRDVFRLSVDGDALLVSGATWARRLKLRSPPYRADAALRECSPGRTLALEISGPLQSPRVHVGGRAFEGNSPGIASAWAFLLHSELLPEPVATGASLAWLALLVMPFGYWARRAVWTLAGAGLVALAGWVAPPLWHIAPELRQALAMSAGFAVGVLLRRRARSRARPLGSPLQEHGLDGLENDEQVEAH